MYASIEPTFQWGIQAMNSRLENLCSNENYAEKKMVDDKE